MLTAVKLAQETRRGTRRPEPKTIGCCAAFLPMSDDFDGAKMTVRRSGKLLFTPMFVVIIALGLTDLLFALDSIPAIFGLTKEPFLVFTANAFALLGLSELYFLLGALLHPAGLPVQGTGRHPAVHRGQADPGGVGRQHAAVPQRR